MFIAWIIEMISIDIPISDDVKISSSDTFQDPKWSRYFDLIDTTGGDQLQRLVKDPYSSNVRISEDQKHGDIL